MKRVFTIILISCLCLALNMSAQEFKTDSDSLISFIGVGDMMFGTHFPYKAEYLPANNDPLPYIKETIPYLKSADVAFGNLEGCLLDEGPVFKHCQDTTKCYAFKMPEVFAPVLKKAGFDVLNLANNHIRDFGELGLKTTRYHLDEMGIKWAGLLDKPIDTLNVKGLKIGMAAFSPNTGTVDINDLPTAISIVQSLKKQCDIVMVSFHGGAEGSKNQHVTRKKEIFYGENRSNVYEFAHAMIDAGADIIFGHGPHVTRAIEIYKGRFIAYSLGNFATYSRFNLDGPNALTPMIKVFTNRNGEFIKGQIIPFKQVKYSGVFYDTSRSVIYKIKDLTHMDFPELNSRLIIEDNGKFSMPFETKLKPLGLDAVLGEKVDMKKMSKQLVPILRMKK